jgi:AcrR family transcriptional regulator
MRSYSDPPSLNPAISAVYHQLFEYVPTRVQRRVVQILEAAIRTYVRRGIEGTTYEEIAKAAKVSRPLVQHYFKDKDALFEMVAKYIRANFQELAVQAIEKAATPREKLERYVGALFVWVKKYPFHAKVWNLIYYYAAVDKNFRKVHTELAEMGHRRITALLEAGARAGAFAGGRLEERAKMIQTLYTGGLIMVTTEDLYVDLSAFEKQLASATVSMATNTSDN